MSSLFLLWMSVRGCLTESVQVQLQFLSQWAWREKIFTYFANSNSLAYALSVVKSIFSFLRQAQWKTLGSWLVPKVTQCGETSLYFRAVQAQGQVLLLLAISCVILGHHLDFIFGRRMMVPALAFWGYGGIVPSHKLLIKKFQNYSNFLKLLLF